MRVSVPSRVFAITCPETPSYPTYASLRRPAGR